MMYSSSYTSLAVRLQELEKFTPTPEQINNLPQGIRDYIMMLEARADPAGDLASLRCAQENAEALLLENDRLRDELEKACAK